jgi:hypothetical protein
MIIIVS